MSGFSFWYPLKPREGANSPPPPPPHSIIRAATSGFAARCRFDMEGFCKQGTACRCEWGEWARSDAMRHLKSGWWTYMTHFHTHIAGSIPVPCKGQSVFAPLPGTRMRMWTVQTLRKRTKQAGDQRRRVWVFFGTSPPNKLKKCGGIPFGFSLKQTNKGVPSKNTPTCQMPTSSVEAAVGCVTRFATVSGASGRILVLYTSLGPTCIAQNWHTPKLVVLHGLFRVYIPQTPFQNKLSGMSV